METSPKYSLDLASLKKIGTGALVAIIGALLTYLTSVIGNVDFGVYTPIVVSVFSILANVVRKWLTDYSGNSQV